MIGDRSMFSFLSSKNDGFVTYRDNEKGKIIGEDDIGTHFLKSVMF